MKVRKVNGEEYKLSLNEAKYRRARVDRLVFLFLEAADQVFVSFFQNENTLLKYCRDRKLSDLRTTIPDSTFISGYVQSSVLLP